MKKIRLSTSHIIMLSFLSAILLGSLLLALPISSASGKAVPYIDALFTAGSATCVTGLVTVPTFSTWSVFGQIVILLLIQVGGLGIITVMASFVVFMHRKLGLSDRVLLQDAFNLNTLSGLGAFVKKVLLGTLLVEGVGAMLYLPVFIKDFGLRGIWVSVFNSVSAFCNAGFDIIAEDSLCRYATHPLINFVTAALIIVAGIGYIVWWDVLRVLKDPKLRRWRHLTLHSKIALTTTAILIFGGALLIFLFEYRNPQTIGTLPLFDKIQSSLFQSVTTRTAGFAGIPQQNLSEGAAMVSCLLMFIGGSPVGTAGGVKTVTIAVLLASAFSTVKNKNETVLFHRCISREMIGKALAVVTMSALIAISSTLLLSATIDAPALDIAYETISATATVGLTRGITPLLNLWGKLIIIATMYLGRIGPISLAIAFNIRTKSPNLIKNPTEQISVG
ncbi:MAG: potassium transporter KtrB [Clostridia bacterium]|nr:potassium transporter KtrB [Clostridia bacterium]